MKRPIISVSARNALLLLALLLGSHRAMGAPGQALPTCAPDWNVVEVASAPRLRHPTAVAVSPDGRVFVCEDTMDMSGPVDQPVNRILCVHPGGRVTVFAEQIYATFGMEYIDGKLYVHHSPRFSVFTDGGESGKDRVDLIKTTDPDPWGSAARGKNQINDHVPAGFQLAMDGYLYIAVGDKGIHGMIGRDGTKLELPVGGLIRMRLDGTELETFATGFRTVLNPALNAEDRIFLYDNNDHLNFHKVALGQVHEGGYYGYPWDSRPPRPEYVLPMDVRVFPGGAPTGILAYEEDGLPASYRGSLFLCDWGRQELVRLTIERRGATYGVTAEEKILSGGFRPTGIAISPDGTSFYIGDWQFPGWRENVVVGRLLKLSYRGKSRSAPKPAWYLPAALGHHFQATIPELVEGLDHPTRSVRMVAQRRLAARGREAIAPLTELVRNPAGALPARWHAIWALDALDHGQAGRDAILAAVDDPAPSVRIQAIRELGIRPIREARSRLLAHCTDPDAAVRFEAVTSLGRLGMRQDVPALRDRLSDDDRLVRYAAFTALNRVGRADSTAWEPIILGLASHHPQVKEGTVVALRETYDQALIAALARFAGRSAQPGPVRAVAFRAIFAMARRPPEWDGLWWRLGQSGYIEDSYDATPSLPKTQDWPGTAAVIEQLHRALDDSDPHVRQIAIEAATLKLDRAVVTRLALLFNDPATTADRPAILRALGAAHEPAAAGPILSVLRGGWRVARAETKKGAGADPPVAANHPPISRPPHLQGQPGLLSAAIAAARHHGGPLMEEAMARLAGDDIPAESLAAALRALGELRVSAAVPTLRARASDGTLEVRIAAARALGEIGDEQAVRGLVACLNDPDVAVRREALGALGSMRAKTAVPELIRAFNDPSTRLDAVAALARVPDLRALDAYLNGLTAKSPGLRDDCRKALTAIKKPASPLILKKLIAGSLSPAVALDLKPLYGDDPSIAPLLEQARKGLHPVDYSAFTLSNRGDLERGRAVFDDPNGVGCARCHRVNGAGGEGGPDLSHIASTYGRAELIESILSPSKKVADGYRLTTIALADGEILSGVLLDNKRETITLVDKEGKKHTIPRSHIEQKTEQDSSPMPDALQSGLTLQEFADLIAYLESLK